MKNVLVIHERQGEHHDVIGVAEDVEKAEKLISEYYGEYKQIHFNDIRDSNLEYEKIIEVKSYDDELYKVSLTLIWYTLNEV